MWLAWGLATGQFTCESFAVKARAAGFAWACLELDDYSNAPRWPLFREACEAEGLKPGVWFTDGGNIASTPDDAAFAIAECEGTNDYVGIKLAIDGGRVPACPVAIATNFNKPLVDDFGRPQPFAAEPLIAAGFECLTECYLGDNPNATPENLDFRAKQLGWSRSQPIFGIYGSKCLNDYAQWLDEPGWSVYLGENAL